MNILIGTALLAGLALWFYRRLAPEQRGEAFEAAWATLVFTLPRIVVALVGAGLFAELLPADRVQALFGQDGGWRGILLAAALGPPTPGGAFVSFAIGAAALKAGASVPSVLAYVTAWGLFSITKIMTYELPLMGARPMWIRLAFSWPFPIVVGAMTAFLV